MRAAELERRNSRNLAKRLLMQKAWAKIRAGIGALSEHVAEFIHGPRAESEPEEDEEPRAPGEIREGPRGRKPL